MRDKRAPDRDAAYAQDVVDCCRSIESYTRGKTLGAFTKDALLQDAIARRLFIIGEATKNLSDEFKSRNPTTDWKNIARLRDRLGHHYWTIEIEKVWEIVVNDIRPLRETIENDGVIG